MQGLYGYIRVGIQRLIDVAQQGGHGGFVRDQRQGVIIFLQLWKSSAGISSRFISDRIWERSNSFQRKGPTNRKALLSRQTEKRIITLVIIYNKIDGVLHKWKWRLFLRIGFLHQDTVAQSRDPDPPVLTVCGRSVCTGYAGQKNMR